MAHRRLGSQASAAAATGPASPTFGAAPGAAAAGQGPCLDASPLRPPLRHGGPEHAAAAAAGRPAGTGVEARRSVPGHNVFREPGAGLADVGSNARLATGTYQGISCSAAAATPGKAAGQFGLAAPPAPAATALRLPPEGGLPLQLLQGAGSAVIVVCPHSDAHMQQLMCALAPIAAAPVALPGSGSVLHTGGESRTGARPDGCPVQHVPGPACQPAALPTWQFAHAAYPMMQFGGSPPPPFGFTSTPNTQSQLPVLPPLSLLSPPAGPRYTPAWRGADDSCSGSLCPHSGGLVSRPPPFPRSGSSTQLRAPATTAAAGSTSRPPPPPREAGAGRAAGSAPAGALKIPEPPSAPALELLSMPPLELEPLPLLPPLQLPVIPAPGLEPEPSGAASRSSPAAAPAALALPPALVLTASAAAAAAAKAAAGGAACSGVPAQVSTMSQELVRGRAPGNIDSGGISKTMDAALQVGVGWVATSRLNGPRGVPHGSQQ